MAAMAEAVKEKIVGTLGVIVTIVAVVALLPTLQSGLADAGISILTYPLVSLLIGIGLLIFAIEAFL